MDTSSVAVAVAERFGLGEPLGALRAVRGGGSHLMWRLRTSFRVHEWCDGRQPTLVTPVGADWVGGMLARLHRLPVGLDPADANRHETYGVEHWRTWLDECCDDVPRAFIE